MEYNEDILKEGLDQVLAIAKQRTQTLENLRQALLDENETKIKFYASQLCGLNHESNRNSKSIDAGTGGR